MEFTQEQKDIFSFVQEGTGHGIIDAVAGAGKTTTIMEAARFVDTQNKILFCAFNNSISKEISKKFKERQMYGVVVKTIHSLGRAILVANNRTGRKIELNNNKYRQILKNPQVVKKLEPLFHELLILNGLDPDSYDKNQKFAIKQKIFGIEKQLLDINQKFRATLTKTDLEEFREMVIHFGIFTNLDIISNTFNREMEVYFDCHKILLEHGNNFSERFMIIDFTDMLYLPILWRLAPSVKYDFLFIDECQDLSKSQFAIAAKYGKNTGRILAVGDPRQSIYGFTGADIESFARVKEYTKAKQLPLTTCFRCPQQVIQIAQSIRKDIVGSKTDAGIVLSIPIKRVTELAQPNDLIICRIKAPLVILVFKFIDKNIKVRIHEDEAIEFISELKRLFKKEEQNQNLKTVGGNFAILKSKVKGRWDWIIQKEAAKINDLTMRQIYISKETKYVQDVLDFLERKYRDWNTECNTVIDMLKKINDFISEGNNPIRLSSIHRAKGLEENRVFIIDYDNLPFIRQEQKDWELVQELNLKYVAVTRAKEVLYLVEEAQIDKLIEEGSLFDELPFDL